MQRGQTIRALEWQADYLEGEAHAARKQIERLHREASREVGGALLRAMDRGFTPVELTPVEHIARALAYA